MHRFTIIFMFLAYTEIAYAALPVDFYLRSEYRKDTIDYSETERIYYGEKLAVLFSRESAFNFSYIYPEHTKESRYTWNLLLKDISPNAYFLAGNYFTHFGSGLLLGRKNLYDPDIFSFRINDKITEKYMNPFSPCNTGNPVFAFNGPAFAFGIQIHETKLAFNLFYSIKERFIDSESYDSGKISTTLETIDTKTKDENNLTEPVEIHTGGLMLSCEIIKNILFQIYFLTADIKGFYKEEINWEYNTSYSESTGISGLNGFGLFAQYKDDFLCFLIDGTVTRKEMILNDNINKKEYGYGILYRIAFNPPFLSLSITGKEVQSSFYSPYSSSIGEDYPESAWFFDAGIKPYTNLKLFTKVSSQKRKAPSSKNIELPVTVKENIILSYSYNFIEEFNIAFKRREKTEEHGEENRQLHTTANIAITKIIKTNLSAVYQYKNNANPSNAFSAGFRLLLTKYLKIDAHFITIYISESNPVYIIASPIKDASTLGFFVKQDSNIIVMKSDLKFKEIFLSGRYLRQFYRKKSLHDQLEFYASGYF